MVNPVQNIIPCRIELAKLFPAKETTEKTFLDYLKLYKPIVFFDLETTGLEGDNTKI